MFTLESVVAILEKEFDVKLTSGSGTNNYSGKKDGLIVYCADNSHDWNLDANIFITKSGLGRSQLELTHFSIVDENQLRQFIEQSKKVLAFYDTI